VVLVAALHLEQRRTIAGRGMRAIAQDRAVAAAFGVDHRRLSLVLGGVAGASAAAAGMVFALTNSLSPSVAYEWFGIVFAVVILGGIGDVVGTLVAGVAVGVVSGVVSAAWSPATAPIVLFSAIVLALVLRPQGLFALRSVVRGAR
jgi:branched-chain amino acid transport system permease protein